MTYFEFYGLPESLNLDPKVIRSKYYALSKQYHPDFHAGEIHEMQAASLEVSMFNTKAYQTLSDFDKLVPYVLELNGMLEEGNAGTLPQEFLMEMMDLNEGIMELQIDYSESGLEKVKAQVSDFEQVLNQAIVPVKANFEHATAAEKQDLLLQLKDYYLKRKYLLRIRESLTKIASPNNR